jgi:hypothetical protein
MMTALLRRSIEGGSYNVKLSLARSAMWVQELGFLSVDQQADVPTKDEYVEVEHGRFGLSATFVPCPATSLFRISCFLSLPRLSPMALARLNIYTNKYII